MSTAKQTNNNPDYLSEKLRRYEEQFGKLELIPSQADVIPTRDLQKQEHALGNFNEANASQMSLARMIMMIVGSSVILTVMALCVIMVGIALRTPNGTSELDKLMPFFSMIFNQLLSPLAIGALGYFFGKKSKTE